MVVNHIAAGKYHRQNPQDNRQRQYIQQRVLQAEKKTVFPS